MGKENKQFGDVSIAVPDDDPAMVTAVAEARARLAEFWAVFADPGSGESHFALKIRIEENGRSEFFWMTQIARTGSRVTGCINNEPETVRKIKMGDKVEVGEGEIYDWLYLKAGKMYGNFTLKPLFPHMDPEEVQKYRAIMADLE